MSMQIRTSGVSVIEKSTGNCRKHVSESTGNSVECLNCGDSKKTESGRFRVRRENQRDFPSSTQTSKAHEVFLTLSLSFFLSFSL